MRGEIGFLLRRFAALGYYAHGVVLKVRRQRGRALPMGRFFGWLTLLGLITGGLAIIFRYMEVAYPLPIILLSLGAGCFLLAGPSWAHTPGNRRVKAAVLGLVGFIVGGTSGFFSVRRLRQSGQIPWPIWFWLS